MYYIYLYLLLPLFKYFSCFVYAFCGATWNPFSQHVYCRIGLHLNFHALIRPWLNLKCKKINSISFRRCSEIVLSSIRWVMPADFLSFEHCYPGVNARFQDGNLWTGQVNVEKKAWSICCWNWTTGMTFWNWKNLGAIYTIKLKLVIKLWTFSENEMLPMTNFCWKNVWL